jgi:hypothetical protein
MPGPSHVVCRARLHAVADSIVTTIPTAPVLATAVALPAPYTVRTSSNAASVRPRIVLSVEITCGRIQSGAAAPMTKTAGIAPLTLASCSRIRPRKGVYLRIQPGMANRRGEAASGPGTVTAPSGRRLLSAATAFA